MLKAQLLVSENMFVLAQVNGVVSFFSIASCERVAVLNQTVWRPLFTVAQSNKLFAEMADDSDLDDDKNKAYQTAPDTNGNNSSQHTEDERESGDKRRHP